MVVKEKIMEQKRVTGCIFVDTPKECCSITTNGKCLDISKLRCVFNHYHLIIADEAKEKLIDLFEKEINSNRRYKRLSGLAGRLGQENK